MMLHCRGEEDFGMTTRILSVGLQQESDVVLARQRARQIAAQLGFDSAGTDAHCYGGFRDRAQCLRVRGRRPGRVRA